MKNKKTILAVIILTATLLLGTTSVCVSYNIHQSNKEQTRIQQKQDLIDYTTSNVVKLYENAIVDVSTINRRILVNDATTNINPLPDKDNNYARGTLYRITCDFTTDASKNYRYEEVYLLKDDNKTRKIVYIKVNDEIIVGDKNNSYDAYDRFRGAY